MFMADIVSDKGDKLINMRQICGAILQRRDKYETEMRQI